MNQSGTRKSALAVVTVSMFLTPFMGSASHIALPSIAKAFKMDAVLLSWVATSFILATVVSLVPSGRWADIYGRKKTFLFGYIIFTISSLFCGLSFGAPMLILFRIFQGIGGALFFAPGPAILISVYPPQERGRVLGIITAAVYTGLSLGPFLGGVMTHYISWRSVYLMNVPLGMFVIILAFWKLKGEWAEAKGEKFDIMGSVLYGLAIIALMYGITLLPALRSLGLILLGFFGIWAFFKWESSVESPVFDLRLFRNNKVFAYSNLAALISYSATFAVTFLLSLYLQNIKGLSPQGAGLILVSQPVVMAIFSPISGRLSDKIEPRIVASIGMAFTTFGLFLLTFLNENSTVTFLLVSLILLGFGFALFASPNTNAIMSSVEKRFYGLASGAMGTMRQLGMMISMGVATLVFAVLIGRVQITPEHYPAFMKSLKWAFSIFSILCLGGIFASLVRGKLRPGDSKEPPRQR